MSQEIAQASREGRSMSPEELLHLSVTLANCSWAARDLEPEPLDFAALERAARGVVVAFPARGWHGEGERA